MPHSLKWGIFVVLLTCALVSAVIFGIEVIQVPEERTVQSSPTYSSPVESSLSGTVVYDSSSRIFFNLDYTSKVRVSLQARRGMGVAITNEIGKNMLGPSGEFIGSPGKYEALVTGPSSAYVSQVGQQVPYILILSISRLTTYPPVTKIVSVTKLVWAWSRFLLVLLPSLGFLLLLVVLIPSPKHPKQMGEERRLQPETPLQRLPLASTLPKRIRSPSRQMEEELQQERREAERRQKEKDQRERVERVREKRQAELEEWKRRHNLEEVLKDFRPHWVYKPNPRGKMKKRLEGGEVGTNAELVRFLRRRNFKVDTEVTLPNGKRADILVKERDWNTIIEAKPNLMFQGKLASLMEEAQAHQLMGGRTKIIVLIYGDVRDDLLYRLKLSVGQSVPVIYLGKLVVSK